jgi:hypothetical protein
MKKLFLAVAPIIIAASATIAISTIPANAGPFCSTFAEGGSFRSCGYPTYASCLRTTSGAGGLCVVNRHYTGYDGSYFYEPGAIPGTTDYGWPPRYYRRPGVGITIGGDID